METATTQPAKNKLNENPNKQQVTEKIFSNPNYNPEKWFDRPRQEIGTTGIEVVDAANNLREKICIDALTGVFNRSYYDRLKTTFDVSRVKDASLAIVFVDMNNLKQVNDNCGHQRGDEVISYLSQLLKNFFRKSDEIIRLGGDEFLVVCHNSDNQLDFLTLLNNRLEVARAAFLQKMIKEELPVKEFAAGIALFDHELDKNLDDLTKRAEQLMYQNKAAIKKQLVENVLI